MFIAVKQLLCLTADFKCVFEEDGCEIPNEVLEEILHRNEKVDLIMVLTGDEIWTGNFGEDLSCSGYLEEIFSKEDQPSVAMSSFI